MLSLPGAAASPWSFDVHHDAYCESSSVKFTSDVRGRRVAIMSMLAPTDVDNHHIAAEAAAFWASAAGTFDSAEACASHMAWDLWKLQLLAWLYVSSGNGRTSKRRLKR